MEMHEIIRAALREDTVDPQQLFPSGDHTSLASVPADSMGEAYVMAKEEGVLAGIEVAKAIFDIVDDSIDIDIQINDGAQVKYGDMILYAKGSNRSLLLAERLVLNFMQRMSGVASLTRKYVNAVEGTGVTVLDTRKTTPNFRQFQKEAVRLGGGGNHRMGLYDMIMIKDNHIDFCGGIKKAIENVRKYQEENGFSIPVEIETRNIDDVKEVMDTGHVTRIMLDNYKVPEVKEAVELIGDAFETEVSGGINLETIRPYAECGPNFISVGALTHSARSLDISMKAKLK